MPFCVSKSGPETAWAELGGDALVSVINSLTYILLFGAAALRWRRLRAARALFLGPFARNLCAVFVTLQTAVGRPQVGRIGVELEGVMRFTRGG